MSGPLSDPLTVDEMAVLAAELCLAEDIPRELRHIPHLPAQLSTFYCTETPNHDGEHRAVDPNTGQVHHTWPQLNLKECSDG